MSDLAAEDNKQCTSLVSSWQQSALALRRDLKCCAALVDAHAKHSASVRILHQSFECMADCRCAAIGLTVCHCAGRSESESSSYALFDCSIRYCTQH